MRRVLLPIIALPLVALLLVPLVAAPSSPLTNPAFTWDAGLDPSTLGLPWYSVSPWEVEVCTRGLTSTLGQVPGQNEITDMSLATPIYRDTITILAKRSEDAGVTYYEVGWYVQPYEGAMGTRVVLMDGLGRNYTLAEQTASAAEGWTGYEAFPEPCDSSGAQCIPFDDIAYAQLSWWTTDGTNNGPVQYLTSAFVNTTEATG